MHVVCIDETVFVIFPTMNIDCERPHLVIILLKVDPGEALALLFEVEV